MSTCSVCGTSSFSTVSREKYCVVVKCEGCGKQYTRVTGTNRQDLNKKVEKEIKSGEMEDRFKKQEKN